MTIAIACNLADGVILGADSAVTLIDSNGNPAWVFNEAEKVTTLWSRPLAIVTWGVAALKERTIRSYIREFESTHPQLNQDDISVEKVAIALHKFLNGKYVEALQESGSLPPSEQRSKLGLFVAGFGNNEYLSEVWEIAAEWDDPGGGVACVLPRGQFDVVWRGTTAGIDRFLRGLDFNSICNLVVTGLDHYGVTRSDEKDAELLGKLERAYQNLAFLVPFRGMPLNEGAELVNFLLGIMINQSRFVMGHGGCGGRVRIVVITRDGIESVSHTPYTLKRST